MTHLTKLLTLLKIFNSMIKSEARVNVRCAEFLMLQGLQLLLAGVMVLVVPGIGIGLATNNLLTFSSW